MTPLVDEIAPATPLDRSAWSALLDTLGIPVKDEEAWIASFRPRASFRDIWDEGRDAEFMLYVATRIGMDRRPVYAAAAECARSSSFIAEADDLLEAAMDKAVAFRQGQPVSASDVVLAGDAVRNHGFSLFRADDPAAMAKAFACYAVAHVATIASPHPYQTPYACAEFALRAASSLDAVGTGTDNALRCQRVCLDAVRRHLEPEVVEEAASLYLARTLGHTKEHRYAR